MPLSLIKIPPLALFVITGLLMWVADTAFPTLAYSLKNSGFLAGVAAVSGLFISLAAVLEFRKAETTVNPLTPEVTTSLVSSGVYRFSRNPMYLGFLLMLIGWAIWLENGLSALFLIGYFIYIDQLQIRPEERSLHNKFGDEFRQYKQSVRRWF